MDKELYSEMPSVEEPQEDEIIASELTEVLLEPEPEVIAAEKFDNSKNLVPMLLATAAGKEYLEKLTSKIIKQCDSAVENSDKLRAERKTVYEVVAGRRDRGHRPWPGASNMKTYLALERVHRLVARYYVEIYVNNPDMWNVLPNDDSPDSVKQARILTEHANWQFREEITDFPAQLMRFLMEFALQGTAYGESSRDFQRNRNRHDTLTFDDLIIPFVHVATEVDMSDIPWVARILRLYDTDIEREEAAGNFMNMEEIRDLKGKFEDNPIEDSARESMANLTGLMPSDDDKDAPRFFLRYHGWSKIVGAPDTRTRAICAIIEPKTKTIVRLYVNEQDDWKDKLRQDQQIVDKHNWEQAAAEHPMLQMQSPSLIVPQPPMPTWMKGNPMAEPAPIKRAPIWNFYRADCIPNMVDQHGIGFGQILVSLESAANSALNCFIDSAELGNDEMLVTAEGTLKKDPERGPGRVIRLQNIDPTQVSDAFHQLKFSGANPQMLDVVRMGSDYADSAIAAPAVLSGEPGKSGETYRGIATRIEQATRQLTAAGTKVVSALSQIAKNNAHLNALFMSDEEVFSVTGSDKLQRIHKSLYQRDYRISFTADMRFVGQSQRTAEADELVQMAMSIPQLAQNPEYMYAIISNALTARGKTDLVSKLGQPPPPSGVPFGAPPAPPPPPGAPPPEGMPPGQPVP